MFAIDGVKLPSNASKRRSEFAGRLCAASGQVQSDDVARLTQDAEQLRAWLAAHPTDRRGPTGGVRQSNRTDNESAKMGTGKGVLQGDTGAAAVDARHQIIAGARDGVGEVLLPVVDAMRAHALVSPPTLITADAGYQSEANLAGLAERNVDALIADTELRQRDEQLATDQAVHRVKKDPLYDKAATAAERVLPLYQPRDFTHDPVARTCVCPAGKSLYRKGQSNVTRGYVAENFRGAKRDCVPCAQRARCLRYPERAPTRQVAFYRGGPGPGPKPCTQRMKARIDTPTERARYAERFGTMEPLFANVCYNKGLARFTLRGRAKVDGQWKLFCLVHTIERLARHGYAA